MEKVIEFFVGKKKGLENAIHNLTVELALDNEKIVMQELMIEGHEHTVSLMRVRAGESRVEYARKQIKLKNIKEELDVLKTKKLEQEKDKIKKLEQEKDKKVS